jgi:hypothetical protein
MTRFAGRLQEGTGESWPLVVAIAGLRSIHDHRRTPSYFERAQCYDTRRRWRRLVKPAAPADAPSPLLQSCSPGSNVAAPAREMAFFRERPTLCAPIAANRLTAGQLTAEAVEVEASIAEPE